MNSTPTFAAAVDVVESLRNESAINPQNDPNSTAVVAGVGGAAAHFADHVEIQVHLLSHENPRPLRSLSSKDVSKMVYVPGIVITTSRAKSKATRLCIQCKTCRNTKHIALGGGYAGTVVPRFCDGAGGGGGGAGGGGGDGAIGDGGGCGIDPFIVLPDKSKFMDQQTMKLQARPIYLNVRPYDAFRLHP